MITISRRWRNFLFLSAVSVYIGYALVYLARKHHLSWKSHLHSHRASIDIQLTAQPEYYTTGPRDNPDQLTVHLPPPGNSTERVNAGFLVLVRNSELYGMLQSMRDVGKMIH